MTYEIWDKVTPINGVEAVDIIGEKQMENDDIFIIFRNGAEIVAIESMATIKETRGLTGDTTEEIAIAYIALRESEISVD